MPSKQVIQINGVDIEWDTQRGCFSFFGAPAALFWINPSLLTMLKPLADEVGHELFRLEVAASASLGTEEDYNAMVTVLGGTFEEGFLKWGEAVSGAGWGIFEILEFNPESCRARVKVSNTWELLMQQALEERWGCPFIQGKIIGIFSKALGVNCWADEGAISYDNDTPFVEFNIYESQKTITTEIERERHKKMKEKERILSAEIAKKTNELQLEKLRAVSANVAKSKFLGAMSHELITPLNGILGLCEILQLQIKDESSESFLQGIMSSGNDMLSLVTQILSYSEVSSSFNDTKSEAFDVSQVIAESIKENAKQAQLGNILLKPLPLNIKSLKIVTDYSYVKDVLSVFISNAIKYIPENGIVEVGIDFNNETNQMEIFVSDNGPGISFENQEFIFNAFERLHHQNGNISGAGVGLAIAKMMVESIAGEIGYETNAIGGAKFWMKLPATD